MVIGHLQAGTAGASHVETVSANLYDYPRYYDLAYGSDWKAEFDFLRACFKKHASGRVRRVFEPACGTGRLLFRLRRAGYSVSGLDLNERAVAFCNKRLARHGFPATVVAGDMTDFELPRPVDAAFNTINSFRHLQTQRQAKAHLQCVARALRPGGVYALGLDLSPTIGAAATEEAWSSRRGHLVVNTHMWIVNRDLRRREERCGMTIDVLTPTRSFRLSDEILFRTYTTRQLKQLLASVPEFETAQVYDFKYDTDAPIEIGADSEDVVLVLRKK